MANLIFTVKCETCLLGQFSLFWWVRLKFKTSQHLLEMAEWVKMTKPTGKIYIIYMKKDKTFDFGRKH